MTRRQAITTAIAADGPAARLREEVKRVINELRLAGRSGIGDFYAHADAQAMLAWADELDAALAAGESRSQSDGGRETDPAPRSPR
jgi:hypothetical protein